MSFYSIIPLCFHFICLQFKITVHDHERKENSLRIIRFFGALRINKIRCFRPKYLADLFSNFDKKIKSYPKL